MNSIVKQLACYAAGLVVIFALNSGAIAHDNDCPLPKPEDMGCKFIGKPCIMHVCIQGSWQVLSNDSDSPGGPDGPDPIPGPAPDISICPRSS